MPAKTKHQPPPKKKVVILGGGVAGLSAAHHLLTKCGDRFEVELYERRHLGGKARSGMKNNRFPTEHGFRFFPGFYKHITETMKEIPLEGGGDVYHTNLVDTAYYTFLFSNKPGRLDVPINIGTWVKQLRFTKVRDLKRQLKDQIINAGVEITDDGKKKLAGSMLEVYTTCNARIDSTYDNKSWREYIDAGDQFNRYGKDYENLLATGISKNLVAVRADVANARTGAKLVGHMIWHILSPGAPPADKVLNAPTDVAWIQPWRHFLTQKGLKIVTGERVVCLDFDPKTKCIKGMRHDKVENAANKSWQYYKDKAVIDALPVVEADYFICAMPIERLDEILDRSVEGKHKIRAYDESFRMLPKLWRNTEWMTGIIYYFDQEIPISNGHITVADEPAAVTIISQMQYWGKYLEQNKITDAQGREVKAILSVIVSDWDAHSKYINRKGVRLKNLTEQEVVEEVAEILFRCEVEPGKKMEKYRKNLLDSFLDDSIVPYDKDKANPRFKPIEGPYCLYNKEPLFINRSNTYHMRPTGYTAFENLFLASDYIKTNADLGCMDSADEAARRAVNNICLKENISTPCKIDLYNLPSFYGLFDTARLLDYRDYKKGLAYRENIIRRLIMWFIKKAQEIYSWEGMVLVRFLAFAGLLLIFLLVLLCNLIVRFFLKMIYVRSI